MEASDVKHLRELEEENRRLKQMYAEPSLDHILQQFVIEKNVKPAVRRELVDYLKQAHGVSVCRARRIAGISDFIFRHRPDSSRNEPVITAFQSATERYPAYGFSKLFNVLKRWSHGRNHKRVHRLYCTFDLNMRRRGKKRLPIRNSEPLNMPATLN